MFIAIDYRLMHLRTMYKLLRTHQITRLGFTHRDIRRAEWCCLRRLSYGVYLVKHVCEEKAHRPLWASIEANLHEPFKEYGDIRDETAALNASVMARFAVRQRRNSDDPDSSREPEIFSHISAALIHGLPVAYPVTRQVEVMRLGINRRFKSIHVRGGMIPRSHHQMIDGSDVTTLERTLVDVARSFALDISVTMLDDVLHRKMTTKERIRAVLAQCHEKRNTKKAVLALELADARRESPAESIAAVRFYQHGIRGMEPQVKFWAESLGRTIRVDFCHQGARLIVEIDGIGKLYLGSGVPRDELEKERRREQWLRDRGWRIIRVSWKELFRDARFFEIARAIASSRKAPA